MLKNRTMGTDNEYSIFIGNRKKRGGNGDLAGIEIGGGRLITLAQLGHRAQGLGSSLTYSLIGPYDGRRAFPDIFLENGSRLYYDMGHPEYCTPEEDNVLGAVKHDQAGMRVLNETSHLLQGRVDRGEVSYDLGRLRGQIVTHKNSQHNGISWGPHQSYQVERGDGAPSLREYRGI